MKLVGPGGPRRVAVADFYTNLGTVLGEAEIVTAVHAPAPAATTRPVFLKAGLRNRFDPALVSVAVTAEVDGSVCRSARVFVGAVSPVPWRASAAVANTHPLRRNGYKVTLAHALVKRALEKMAAGAQ